MIKLTQRQKLAGILFASTCMISITAHASEVDQGSAGEGSPKLQTEAAVSTEFDDSSAFVPPSELPIVDTYIKDAASLSEAEAREELTTVSITPEGEVEVVAPDDEDVRAMREAIGTLEGESDAGSEASDDQGLNESNKDFASQSNPSESVIGTDTRVRVNGTRSYPFRAVGRIDSGCTGTLIGPRHVLTAGHCVYNIRTDKWYSRLSFSPGQNGSSRPFGKIGWKRVLSVKGWTRDHKRNYDYAMIILKKDVGKSLGWLGYGWKNPMPKYNVNINGYPGDKPFGTMWHAYCKLAKITRFRLYYPCDTFGGMSGSGVYLYRNSNKSRTIYGIHAYGVDGTGYNGATRIRKSVFNRLKGWKARY